MRLQEKDKHYPHAVLQAKCRHDDLDRNINPENETQNWLFQHAAWQGCTAILSCYGVTVCTGYTVCRLMYIIQRSQHKLNADMLRFA